MSRTFKAVRKPIFHKKVTYKSRNGKRKHKTLCGLKVMVLFFILLLTSCSCRNHETKLVTLVGGCDKWGECGVMTSDGKTGHADYPVAGALTDVCTSW